MRKYLRLNRLEIIFLLLIIGAAALVRFRGLTGLSFFTYDQARDALFIKRIIVDHKLRLIGTQSSIPGLYTGPFYYYLMAPFLAVFGLNPVGLDFGTAIISLFSIILLFCVLREETKDSVLSLVFTTLFSFSPVIVNQSRFAWNPNPLPFFSLVFLYSAKKVFLEKKEKFLIPLAFSIGVSINLHYSGLAWLFILSLVWFFFRPRIKNKRAVVGFFLILFFCFLPLFLFDLRHRFINVGNIFRYFLSGVQSEIPPPPFLAGLWQKLVGLFGLVFVLPAFWVKALTGACLFFGFTFLFREIKTKKTFFTLCFLTLLGGVLFSGFYRGSFFFFYLTFLYPLPFLLVALFFKRLVKKIYLRNILVLFLSLIFVLRVESEVKRSFPSNTGAGRIVDLTRTARFLSEKIGPGEKYNLVALYKNRDRYTHNAVDYRYFLEAKFNLPVPGWDVLDYQQAGTVYLVSEVGKTAPLELSIWELDLFDPRAVVETWDLGQDIVVYKLEK